MTLSCVVGWDSKVCLPAGTTFAGTTIATCAITGTAKHCLPAMIVGSLVQGSVLRCCLPFTSLSHNVLLTTNL